MQASAQNDMLLKGGDAVAAACFVFRGGRCGGEVPAKERAQGPGPRGVEGGGRKNQQSFLKPPPQLPTVHAGRMSPAFATPGSGAGTPASKKEQRSCAKRIIVSQLFEEAESKL